MKNAFMKYRDALWLTLSAIPLGAVTGALCALFGRVLLAITDFRTAHYLFLLPFLGLVGAGLVLAYRRFGGDAGKGMSLLYEAEQGKRGSVPLRLIPMVMGATWLTHLFGGSAGREGVAVQLGGVLGYWTGKHLRTENAARILMLSGMAAGFGGLFRTPLAAAFFAMEVLAPGSLMLESLLPCLASALTASAVSGALGLGKFTVLLTASAELSLSLGWKLAVLGLAFGLAGFLFSFALKKLKPLFAKWLPDPTVRILVIGTAVGLISLLCLGGRYSGLGTNLIAAGFADGILPWDFAAKLLFTVVTLSAGFFGGEVTPLFSIGVSLGYVLGTFLGLPPELCAALGYAAVFGAASKTLIAPVLIGAEVFGASYLPLFLIVCAVAYFCSGRTSIYPLQRFPETKS